MAFLVKAVMDEVFGRARSGLDHPQEVQSEKLHAENLWQHCRLYPLWNTKTDNYALASSR